MITMMFLNYPRFSGRRMAFCLALLLLIINAGCVSAGAQPPVQPTPSAIEPSQTPETLSAVEPSATPTTTSALEPSAAPTTPPATATSEALIPAGWTTHTSQRCEYALGAPADMQISYDTPYSSSLDFNQANLYEGVPNFIYISVVDQEFRSLNVEDVYNYDPAQAERLLSLQVGEGAAMHPVEDMAQYFTYQRLADRTINGHPAQAYENIQPWEFPEGTKEIRYYLSLNGCMYQIGGFVDTSGSNQPGAITEDLFNQIVASMRVMP